MGLLNGSKSRRKILKDPNNTKWTRDVNTFGQKILRAQGWQPGQFLGVQNSAHSELHTADNASYIRISLKDDVKGLGYNKAKQDVVTGLDVFSDLLSRLNGKSEEAVEGQRQAKLLMKTNSYVEQKWGPMRFVRGGLLMGEDMDGEEPAGESSAAADNKGDEGGMMAERSISEKKSKKRKAGNVDGHDAESESKKERKRRKEGRKAKKASTASMPDDMEDGTSSNAKTARKQKSKKDQTWSGQAVDDQQVKSDSADDGLQRRAIESKSKDKHSSIPADGSNTEDAKKERKSKKRRREKVDAELGESSKREEHGSPAAGMGGSTPTDSGTGTCTPKSGRHLVRSRFIAAKRQAMLDTKALNQIFMVKT